MFISSLQDLRKSFSRIGDCMYMKKCIINHKWQYIGLTDEEEKSLLEELRKDNLELMKRCLEDSKGLMKVESTEIAVALFERIADAKFTRIQAKLDEKINMAETEKKDAEIERLREEKIEGDSRPTIDKEIDLVI